MNQILSFNSPAAETYGFCYIRAPPVASDCAGDTPLLHRLQTALTIGSPKEAMVLSVSALEPSSPSYTLAVR